MPEHEERKAMQSRWKSAHWDPPELNIEVLVYIEGDRDFYLAKRVDDIDWIDTSDEKFLGRVDYWMDLPEPPVQ